MVAPTTEQQTALVGIMARQEIQVEADISLMDFGKVTRQAVDRLAKELEGKEREDVAAAGMQRFANRTTVRVKPVHGGWDVYVNLKPGWMKAWETGAANIVPKRPQKTAGVRLLWIPVPDAPRIRARGYRRIFGKLYRPKGKNVLIDMVSKKVAYVGIPQHSIPSVLHTRDIANEEAEKFVKNLREYT
jgi:hypothetical protein